MVPGFTYLRPKNSYKKYHLCYSSVLVHCSNLIYASDQHNCNLFIPHVIDVRIVAFPFELSISVVGETADGFD